MVSLPPTSSLPLLISLSSYPSLFFYPHLRTVPASFPQLLSRAGHNIGCGVVVVVLGGESLHGGRGGEGGGDVYMDVMRGGDSR